MRLLFAISVVSFCTVLWVALALARRIERERLARRRPPQRAPAAEFFEAGEYRTPRPMPNQHVAAIRSRPVAAEPGISEPAAGKSPASELTRLNLQPSSAMASGPVRHLWPSPSPKVTQTPIYANPMGESRHIIDSSLRLVGTERPHPIPFPSPSATTAPVASLKSPPRDLSGERKSPQAALSGTFRRVDLSHYNNEDMGDLTDPYTHIVRPSGVRRAVRKT